MATTKDGMHIKGTKKELINGWVTSGYQFALLPNPDQCQALERAFGCERKVYNEYVAGLYEYLEKTNFQGGRIDYKAPAYPTITAQYHYLDKSNDACVYNDAKRRFQAAITKYNADYAFKPMTYKKGARKKIKSMGYEPTLRDVKGLPKFHSKKQGKLSYTTSQTNGNIRLVYREDGVFLRIPKFREGILIVMHRPLPDDAVIKKATVRREGDRYLVSLSVDYPANQTPLKQEVAEPKILGLDYSQTALYVDSEGREAGYPRYHAIIQKRQRRLNQRLARQRAAALIDKEGNPVYSKRYQHTLTRYQRTMAKAKHQRKDFLHKRSTEITNSYDAIVVEDLNLTNLAQCLKLGKKLHDNGFGMFRTQLKYKAEKKGKHYLVADPFYPSSKRCSECGKIKETLPLSMRVYTCDYCHTKMDRDYNAGRNLKQYGMTLLQENGVAVDPVYV
ncbi:hypothetical protein CN918_31710 [Priestia megaterium]|nr:hypothetical protein CN918_31710 [Priestia megaterium]